MDLKQDLLVTNHVSDFKENVILTFLRRKLVYMFILTSPRWALEFLSGPEAVFCLKVLVQIYTENLGSFFLSKFVLDFPTYV